MEEGRKGRRQGGAGKGMRSMRKGEERGKEERWKRRE